MKILQCMFCKGELEIIQDHGFNKKVKCLDCGYSNLETKEPEVLIIKRSVRNNG